MRRRFIIVPNYRAALHQPGNNESLIQQPLLLRNYWYGWEDHSETFSCFNWTNKTQNSHSLRILIVLTSEFWFYCYNIAAQYLMCYIIHTLTPPHPHPTWDSCCKCDQCVNLDLVQTGLCWVYVWSGGGGEAGGTHQDWSHLWVSARVLLSFTGPDLQFPASVPKATTVQGRLSGPIHAHLSPSAPVCRVSSSHLAPLWFLTSSVELRPVPVWWLQLFMSLFLPPVGFIFGRNMLKVGALPHCERNITPDAPLSTIPVSAPFHPARTENPLSCRGRQECLPERVVFTGPNRCSQWGDRGHRRNSPT